MLFASPTHRIHYDLIGPERGAVVLFAHALVADGGMWAGQVPPLAQVGFRTLRMDMRGHGGSGAPATPCSIMDLARDVIALLDHLSLPSVHFVGLSIGGVIGQTLAINFRGRLASLALSDTTLAAAPNHQTMWAERTALVEKAGSAAPLAPPMMPRLLSAGFKARDPLRWREIEATIEATPPEGVYAGAQALRGYDYASDLPGLTTPTPVVCGQNDPATPPGEAKKIASLIPKARYAEIPDGMHFPNVEHPELYASVLLEWLREPYRN
jgi:3-oxoadipate enol-lactonase